MCKPASFVVTKDRLYWSRATESHSQIIDEYKLHADGVRGPNIAKVEIVPPDDQGRPNYRLPLDQWTFRLDEEVTPDWCDVADIEGRVRESLPEWVAMKIVLPDETRTVMDGGMIVACYGTIQDVWGGTVQDVWGGTIQNVWGGTIQDVQGGTIQDVWGGTIQNVWGGTIQDVQGGTVQDVRGGTIQAVRGGTVQDVWGGQVVTYTPLSPDILKSSRAVLIDRSGETVVCHVGRDQQ